MVYNNSGYYFFLFSDDIIFFRQTEKNDVIEKNSFSSSAKTFCLFFPLEFLSLKFFCFNKINKTLNSLFYLSKPPTPIKMPPYTTTDLYRCADEGQSLHDNLACFFRNLGGFDAILDFRFPLTVKSPSTQSQINVNLINYYDFIIYHLLSVIYYCYYYYLLFLSVIILLSVIYIISVI